MRNGSVPARGEGRPTTVTTAQQQAPDSTNRAWNGPGTVDAESGVQANLTRQEVAMLSRLFPYFSRFLCCTGYEIVTITVH